MGNVEELIKGLSEKLDVQSREIKTLRTKLDHRDYRNKKGESDGQKVHEHPRYQTNNVNYHRDGHGQRYYTEYTVKERIYYPERGHIVDREDRTVWDRGGCHATEEYYKSSSFTPRKCGRDGYAQHKQDHGIKHFGPKPKSVKDAEIKIGQNHLPFVVDKAYKPRTCGACWKEIAKGELIILHKEIKVSRDAKQGWDKPIYSKDPIETFYHFDSRCLKLRGFEDSYLSLCYIEVCARIKDKAAASIYDLGFRRPIKIREMKANILEKQSAESGGVKVEEHPIPNGNDNEKNPDRENDSKVPDDAADPKESPVETTPNQPDIENCENDLDEPEFDFCI